MADGTTIIDDWIAEGEARGRYEQARRIAMSVFWKRFGELPSALVERIEQASAEECERLVERALEIESLEELDA